MDLLIVDFGRLNPLLGFALEETFKVLVNHWVCSHFFNHLVVELVVWYQLFHFWEGWILSMFLQIGHKGFTEVFCNVLCVSLLNFITCALSSIFLFENQFFLTSSKLVFRISIIIGRVIVLGSVTWVSRGWRGFSI